MVTSAILCPACGAADGSPEGPHGVHRCSYCGVRYQVRHGAAAVLPRLDLDKAGEPSSSDRSRGVRVGAAVGFAGLGFVLVAVGVMTTLVVWPAPRGAPAPVTGAELSAAISSLASANDASPAQLGHAVRSVALPAGDEVAAAEADPSAEFVLHSVKDTSIGSKYLYGVLTNTSPFAIDAAKVTAVFLDAEGAEMGTAFGFAERSDVPPGATTPVEILVQDPPDWAQVRFEPSPSRQSWKPAWVEGLRIEPSPPKPGSFGSGLTFEGKVHHEGKVPARFVEIELQAFDAQDKLVGVETTYADGDVLRPGTAARWNMLSVTFADTPSRFEFAVTARAAD